VLPHGKEVMNDLITKLTREARVVKNGKRLNVSGPKSSEVVTGTKNRSRDIMHSSTDSVSTTHVMQIRYRRYQK
jgi:hypothetical protein